MSTEYGIFNDESPDHTGDSAVESQMSSREEAEARLAAIRAENGDVPDADGVYDDNCYVHEVEEPDDEEYEEEDDYDLADGEGEEEEDV